MAEPIEMPFDMYIWVGLRSRVLDMGTDPMGRSTFEAVGDVGISRTISTSIPIGRLLRRFGVASNFPARNPFSTGNAVSW